MKRMLTALLALMMLVLPVSSMAMTPDSLMSDVLHQGKAMRIEASFEVPEGSDLTKNEALTDLLKSLKLVLCYDTSTDYLALELSDKTALYAGLDVSGVLYTNLLGERPISVLDADMQVITDYLSKITGEDMSGLGLFSFGGETDGLDATSEQPQMNISFVDLEAVLNNATVEAVTEQNPQHDPAKTKTTIIITGDQMADMIEPLLDSLLANETIVNALKGQGLDLASARQNIRKLLTQGYEDARLEIWLDEQQAPVYATFTMRSKLVKGVNILWAYVRRTVNDEPVYAMQLTLADDKDTVEASYVQTKSNDQEQQATATLKMISNGETIETVNAVYKAQTTNHLNTYNRVGLLDITDVTKAGTETAQVILNTAADRYADEFISIDLGLRVNNKNALAMHIGTTVSDGSFKPDLTNVARASEMTEKELNTWLKEALGSVQPALLSAMQKLPSSVLMELMKLATPAAE